MHFSALLVLVTAITGAHARVLQRDTKPIIKVFKDVQTDIVGLSIAYKRWIEDFAPVLKASDKLMATIEQDTSTVQGSANLTLNEALSLHDPFTTLGTDIRTLVEDILERKKYLRKAGLCRDISSQLTSIVDKSKGLADTTVSKVPPGARNLVKKEHAQEIFHVLARAQVAFSADNCKNVTTAKMLS